LVGFIRNLRAPFPRFLVALAAAVVAVAVALQPGGNAKPASAECAFPFTPTAYEDLKNRQLFLNTIELASFDMLFPGDPYFSLGQIESGPRNSRKTEPAKVPPVLLKSIAWIESSITQADVPVPFGSIGPSLISFDCGHGVAQVTTGMTVPAGESGRGSPQQALVATNFAYNIARGARILVDKWNQTPEDRPLAGTDTNGSPLLLENWYFAIWSYNGFTGPGADRSNHPMDPIYGAWPRPGYSCGSQGDGKGHNRANYPYQELVIGCAANAPVVDGKPLWNAQVVSLPDLNNPAFKDKLDLKNFVFPYVSMDIPTPQSFHQDTTPRPSDGLRSQVLGSPQMGISRSDVKLGVAGDGGSTVELVEVTNGGSGVLSWYATTTSPWLKIAPYTGVAVGANLPCEPDAPCERKGKMELSVDTTKLPGGTTTGQIVVQALGTDQQRVINVTVTSVTRLGAPGIRRD
jgi:hypothetical protein